VKELMTGGISVVRPSRQPLRGFLRMRAFLNAISNLPHAEERPFETPPAEAPQDKRARLEARTTPLPPTYLPFLDSFTHCEKETSDRP
jgi:hypothetical protein